MQVKRTDSLKHKKQFISILFAIGLLSSCASSASIDSEDHFIYFHDLGLRADVNGWQFIDDQRILQLIFDSEGGPAAEQPDVEMIFYQEDHEQNLKASINLVITEGSSIQEDMLAEFLKYLFAEMEGNLQQNIRYIDSRSFEIHGYSAGALEYRMSAMDDPTVETETVLFVILHENELYMFTASYPLAYPQMRAEIDSFFASFAPF